MANDSVEKGPLKAPTRQASFKVIKLLQGFSMMAK
jgi:hypothetical protein